MARPGRREQPVDLPDGPLADLFADLRKLRHEAGDPSYRTMAHRSGHGHEVRSHTTLSEVTTRPHLPTWGTLAAYIRGLGHDPEEWRLRWREVQARSTGPASADSAPLIEPSHCDEDNPHLPRKTAPAGTAANGEAVEPQPLVEETTLAPRRQSGHSKLLVAAVGVIALFAVAGAIFGLVRPDSPPESATSATIVVQNMVAEGQTMLREDTTSAYLSTRTIPSCAKYDCKVAGSDMWSGARLTAACQVEDTHMSNANEQTPRIDGNPHAARSARWYGARLANGSLAYISEVYVRPQDRGGLRLPDCSELGD